MREVDGQKTAAAADRTRSVALSGAPGPTGTVNLQFDAAVTRFDNLARDDQALEQH